MMFGRRSRAEKAAAEVSRRAMERVSDPAVVEYRINLTWWDSYQTWNATIWDADPMAIMTTRVEGVLVPYVQFQAKGYAEAVDRALTWVRRHAGSHGRRIRNTDYLVTTEKRA